MIKFRRILAKLLFCDEALLDLVLMHMPVGLFNVFLFAQISPWLGLLFGWGFVQYEKSERTEIHDTAYPDIQGWLWGLVIAAVIWRCIK